MNAETSAPGTKLTFPGHRGMSASKGEADMTPTGCHFG